MFAPSEKLKEAKTKLIQWTRDSVASGQSKVTGLIRFNKALTVMVPSQIFWMLKDPLFWNLINPSSLKKSSRGRNPK
ncbi:unnamed protein product [Sphenostylis stenocarpa]|uniref:Uncharacterized protein n=1 Tax=Sphenostylis stenocarpa TaxID=92480 RepID=A0AA86VCM1_9FABA|nr:unnamed protein product [Sphenostylis stenocarpa]